MEIIARTPVVIKRRGRGKGRPTKDVLVRKVEDDLVEHPAISTPVINDVMERLCSGIGERFTDQDRRRVRSKVDKLRKEKQSMTQLADKSVCYGDIKTDFMTRGR